MGRRALFLFYVIAAGYGVPSVSAQPLIPPTADDVVILAKRLLVLRAGTQHTRGQLAVNDAGGKAIAKSFRAVSTLAPSLLSDIVISRQAGGGNPPTEFYYLFANSYSDRSRGSLIAGSGPIPIAADDFPLFPFPAQATVTPGVTDVEVRSDEVLSLPPGAYGRIRLHTGATLFFQGGTYNVGSLISGLRASIRFVGPTTLNVADRIKLGARTSCKPVESDPPLNTRCIVINAGGRVRLDRATVVSATINAPDDRLVLGRGGVYRGNFTADRVRVGINALLEAESPLTTPCP